MHVNDDVFKHLITKDRGLKELLLELVGPEPMKCFFKKASLLESQIFKVLKLKPIFQNACFYLARAGVAMSVWTAMDMGTPPQWMLPRVSFSAMLYLGVSRFKTFLSDVNIFHLHPRS